jgi:hypothetical protein
LRRGLLSNEEKGETGVWVMGRVCAKDLLQGYSMVKELRKGLGSGTQRQLGESLEKELGSPAEADHTRPCPCFGPSS